MVYCIRMTAKETDPAFNDDGLKADFFGRKAIYYPRLESTMDIARREAQRGTTQGTVIIAGEQTSGRGRAERAWLSPKGNIALSIILYPDISQLPFLIMIASLAVVHSIESVTGLKTWIKWPNDILMNGKKVCGILIENEVKNNKLVYSIIGIGINVAVTPKFGEVSASATSLKDELGGSVLRAHIIKQLLFEIERMYLMLPDENRIFQEWQDRMITLGKEVSVNSGNAILEGVAESVDKNGALLLRHTDGSSTKVVAGDVSLRDNYRQ